MKLNIFKVEAKDFHNQVNEFKKLLDTLDIKTKFIKEAIIFLR